MNAMRSLSRVLARFNRWLAPAAAAGSALHDNRVGTYVDPGALQLMVSEMARDDDERPTPA